MPTGYTGIMATDAEHQDLTREPIRLKDTDDAFPQHWKSGSLKYDDFKPLTEGGTAALQTCLDRNLHRRVVFKSLHPHLRDSEQETQRFLREARVTAMIAHPGTVPVYEIGRDRSGALYFTMKLLVGRDLRDILMKLAAKDRPTQAAYPLERLVDILISTGQTISYAHAQGIIHRDLKPANILVGEFGEVTVLDWGLAKVKGEPPPPGEETLTGREGIRLELTQPGRRFGTPLYMSPEQARGDMDMDERCDVYNLGSVLFEVLTLKNLVWGNDVNEVLQQVLERPTPAPRDVSPGLTIPRELEAVCLKCLHKDPGDRYQSVQALTADLVRYRDRQAVSVCDYGPLERFRQFNRRHLAGMAALAGGLVGAAVCWLVLRG